MRIANRTGVILALACGCVTAGSAAPPADKAPRRFTPVGQWAMEYADDSCRLIRNFRSGDNDLTLALERFSPGAPFSIGIASGKARAWASAREVHLQFFPAESGSDL
jgi:hypothetical protein